MQGNFTSKKPNCTTTFVVEPKLFQSSQNLMQNIFLSCTKFKKKNWFSNPIHFHLEGIEAQNLRKETCKQTHNTKHMIIFNSIKQTHNIFHKTLEF
jgi:hypothetical protein